MRVAVVSHASVVEVNRGKLRALAARHDVELLALAPDRWVNRDIGQTLRFRASTSSLLRVASLRVWFAGYGSVFTYSPRTLFAVLRQFRPHLIHVEEEPWSIAALELSVMSTALGAGLTVFTWENLDKPLNPPLRSVRRFVLRRARGAVAGNEEGRRLLEAQGFQKSIAVIPQLGVDPELFSPQQLHAPDSSFVVGYVGRLVPQKGLRVLLDAVSRLPDSVRILLVGTGPFKADLLAQAKRLGLNGRLELREGIGHHEVPEYLIKMSALVLPSLTTPVWKEQFGHALIEGMACGIPVVGSDSGAIPEVIGNAGLVVHEGDAEDLAAALDRLARSPRLRRELAERGRDRVITEYTDSVIALRLAMFWHTCIGAGAGAGD